MEHRTSLASASGGRTRTRAQVELAEVLISGVRPNNTMPRTSHGQDGVSPLILALDARPGPAIRSRRMARAVSVLMLAMTLLMADRSFAVADEPIWHSGSDQYDSEPAYDVPPKLLRTATPEYPKAAYEPGREGTVVLEILIDAEGRVMDARVTKSIAEFDRAALACVSQWRFIPAQRRGHPVPAKATAMVIFKRPPKARPTTARGEAPSNGAVMKAFFNRNGRPLPAELRSSSGSDVLGTHAKKAILQPAPSQVMLKQLVLERVPRPADIGQTPMAPGE